MVLVLIYSHLISQGCIATLHLLHGALQGSEQAVLVPRAGVVQCHVSGWFRQLPVCRTAVNWGGGGVVAEGEGCHRTTAAQGLLQPQNCGLAHAFACNLRPFTQLLGLRLGEGAELRLSTHA